MERSCARAVDLGLRSVAFTDHADFTAWTLLDGGASFPARLQARISQGVFSPPPLPLDGYLDSLLRCRDRFPELHILSGVELSEPHWHSAAAASLLHQGAFDLVLCGQHALVHGPGGFVEVSGAYSGADEATVVRAYLAEVAHMIDAWDEFTVLAHIDYPVRTWPGHRSTYRPRDFEDEYRAVLRTLAGSGRVLEVNTQVPLHAEVVQWWHDEGGAAVSFGSDAHDPFGLAHRFGPAAALVEASGFCPGRRPHDFWLRT